jgi:hypothetical protein
MNYRDVNYRDAHEIMRFSFYFWSLAEIADIYFLWFIKSFSLDLLGLKKTLAFFIFCNKITPDNIKPDSLITHEKDSKVGTCLGLPWNI